jgi:hypothetical protein
MAMAGKMWYNVYMTYFGNGPTLKEAFPWLRDDETRIERILTVTEVNSVIEGLPPLQEDTRQKIRQHLSAMSAQASTPAG